MIEFKGTGFTYDGERFVLDGVDARIERGEFVCVLGGNGSGKSTLAKHVNALLVPDEGSVTVLDRDTRDERSTYFIRSNAGMVFQNPDDQLVASLIENDVAFGPENLGVPTDQLRQRVAEGRTIRYLVPEAVREIIEEEQLYRKEADHGRLA